MTEMHLDLCIQSTTHLLETVASIKENVRMLEVFLNSGLQIVDCVDTSIGTPNNEGYSNLDNKFYHYLNSSPNENINRHLNCCCMCRFRGDGPRQRQMNGTISRVSVGTTVSNSSNTNSSKKKAHITPRLNKTASLRKAKILQRISTLRN